MKNANEKFSVVKGEASESVHTKLQAVLKINPGFYTLTVSVRYLMETMYIPLNIILLRKIHLLKYAPVTSCDVESPFSAYKHILSDKNNQRPPENMEKILIVYCP
jgi:hypothetical protein